MIIRSIRDVEVEQNPNWKKKNPFTNRHVVIVPPWYANRNASDPKRNGKGQKGQFFISGPL